MNNLEKIQQKLHKINFNENDGIVCPKPIWLKKVTPEEYRFGNLTKNDKTKKREHIYNLDCCPYCNEKCKDISPILQGDAKSVSIAAASIVAKVTRDRMMEEYDKVLPEYGFASNKGYGSAAHIEALKKYGPSPIHRKTFITHFV